MSSQDEIDYWKGLADNLVDADIKSAIRDHPDARVHGPLVDGLRKALAAILSKPTLPRLKAFCADLLEPYVAMFEPHEFGKIENIAIREHLLRVHGPKLEADVAALMARGTITTERQYRLAMSTVDRWLGEGDRAPDVEKLNEALRGYEARLQKRIDRARARRRP